MAQLDSSVTSTLHPIGDIPRGVPLSPEVQMPLPGLEQPDSVGYTLMAMAREPMAVLDRRLRLVAASRSYYRKFPVKFSTLLGRPFCEPSVLAWPEPALRTLEDVAAGNAAIVDFAIELEVPSYGPRQMLLNARRLNDPANPEAAILVGLEDVTDSHENARLRADLLTQRDALLQEAHHRIANSLQIIASILLLRARSAQSQETRVQMRDVHKRLILIASVQRQLSSSGMRDKVEFGPYVAHLCEGLSASMTDDSNAVTIVTSSSGGFIKSDDAVNFGLIVTELVINALKHGFPDGRRGQITIAFAASGGDWRLTVSDDGVGRPPKSDKPGHAGLGTYIVDALALHLKAKVEVSAAGPGSTTAIVHMEAAADVPPGNVPV